MYKQMKEEALRSSGDENEKNIYLKNRKKFRLPDTALQTRVNDIVIQKLKA